MEEIKPFLVLQEVSRISRPVEIVFIFLVLQKVYYLTPLAENTISSPDKCFDLFNTVESVPIFLAPLQISVFTFLAPRNMPLPDLILQKRPHPSRLV